MDKNRSRISFILIIMIMTVLPLLLTNTEEGAVSVADGRTFRAKPLINEVGYPSNLEAYLRDRLGMGDSIRAEYASASDVLTGEFINSAYQNGKKGWTFFKLHNNNDDAEYYKAFAEHVHNMQEYCESRGSKFYYVFNPEKESAYRRYLPAGVNYDDSWADEMLAYMDRLGVSYIDLRDVLMEKSSGEDVFNRRVDAGHWNHTGAFYGMRKITERMHDDDRSIKVLDKKEYDIETVINDKMYGSNQIINEETPSYTLKAGYTVVTGTIGSEINISESYPHIAVYENDSKEASAISTMLVLDDDLYTAFSASRARETVEMTGLQNAVNLDYYYNVFRPEVVVFETMEYVISDTYFNSEAMAGKTWSPAAVSNYPADSFSTRKEDLLAHAEKFDSDISIIVEPGKKLDRIHLSKLLDAGEFVYILSDNGVTDMQRKDNSALGADVRHNEFRSGGTATVYYVDAQSRGHYTEADIVSTKNEVSHTSAENENILCYSGRPILGNSDYVNGVWRVASGGTGIREIADVDRKGVSKGFHITGEVSCEATTEVGIDEVPVEYGKTYVLSCYAKGSGQLHIEEGKTSWDGESYDVTDKWKQYSYTFTVGEKDGVTEGDPYISVYYGVNGSVDSDILICGMKLERSDSGKPTKWTANPDDAKRERILPY